MRTSENAGGLVKSLHYWSGWLVKKKVKGKPCIVTVVAVPTAMSDFNSPLAIGQLGGQDGKDVCAREQELRL